MFGSSVVDQVRMAAQKQNRLASAAGFVIGGFVPAATFFLVHYGVGVSSWLWLIVAGGLLFSAKTVFEWGRVAFNNGWKAFGFCLLVEGVMTFSPANLMYLSVAGLGMLTLINGVATGCNLALNRKEASAAIRAARPKPEKKAKPAQRKKSIRMPKARAKRKAA